MVVSPTADESRMNMKYPAQTCLMVLLSIPYSVLFEKLLTVISIKNRFQGTLKEWREKWATIELWKNLAIVWFVLSFDYSLLNFGFGVNFLDRIEEFRVHYSTHPTYY